MIVLALLIAWTMPASSGATEYVDGISDQSIPTWDSYFPSFFTPTWISGGHVTLARYVVQWDVMSGVDEEDNKANERYRREFIQWIGLAGNSWGLTLDVSLTSYTRTYPTSSAQYKERLKEILTEARSLGHPVRYVEPWNEPNNQGNEPEAAAAAHFSNAAYSACEEGFGCTDVAGNVEDNSGARSYEERYRENLSPVPSFWGIHAYNSVEYENESYYAQTLEGLPNKGSGQHVWITEVAARQCKPGQSNGEVGQAERAQWLVSTLMRNEKPEHVFYYEFLKGGHAQPECAEYDDALYAPSSDPNAPDRPRPAAAWIFGNTGKPWAYTGGAGAVYKRYAYLEGSVYPSAKPTNYYFEYGTSPGSKANSSVASAGSGIEDTSANMGVEGLTPNTTYYYRIVAYNSEGENTGVEKTFTTESAPPSATTEPAAGVTRTTATLIGQVYPDGLPTEYYFEYNEVGGGAAYTQRLSAGGDESWHWESQAVSGLKSCTRYQFQIYAANADPPSPVSGGVREFETECWPPQATTEAATEVKRRSAVLQGKVYPNGLPTKYWFEYGKQGGFEASTESSESGSDRAWHGEHATVSLEPCTIYQFRIVAENEDSRNGPPKGVVAGETKTFETKCRPVIRATEASELKPTSVVLNTEVNPEEAETTYHFEYDTREYKEGEAAHGTSVPARPAAIGAGVSFLRLSDVVVNLKPGQTYYFRASAKNESGETVSAGQSFKAPVDWELNGAFVPATTPVTAEGTLLVKDGSQLTMECAVKEQGTVGTYGTGTISKLAAPAGESPIPCTPIKLSTLVCEKGSGAELEASNLSWASELLDEPIKNQAGEVVRDEVRLRFKKSEEAPTFKLLCQFNGTKEWRVQATCSGEFSGNAENISAGVPIEFDPKSPRLTCTGNLSGKATIGGTLTFKSTEAEKTLSAYGAPIGPQPPDVQSAEATVTATGATLSGALVARGAETTYRFEYGSTSSYGDSVPVPSQSAGSGRVPASALQTLEGLETSTLYHFRLVATNSAGMTYGEDQTFTTGYPAKWQVNDQKAEVIPTKGEGTLVLEDASLGVAAECAVVVKGQIISGRGEISKLTNAKGEPMLTCHTLKQGWCGAAPVEVQPLGLPWSATLFDESLTNGKGEQTGVEPRDRFGSGSGGWQVSCNALGSVVTDMCSGEPSGGLENVPAGVAIDFDGKSGPLTCTGSSIGAGALNGSLLMSTEGGTLSVYGARSGP